MQFRDLDEERNEPLRLKDLEPMANKSETFKEFHVCLWDRNNDETINDTLIPKGIIYIEKFKEGSIGYFVSNVLNEVVKLKVSSFYKISIFKESWANDFDSNEKYDRYKHCYIVGEFVIDSTVYHVYFDKVDESDVKLPPHKILSIS